MAEKLLFFFSALGVFNASILAAYLLYLGKDSILNRFYAFLLFLLTIRVGISCIHFFDTIPHSMIKLGLLSNLLLGPTLFFIINFSNNKRKNLSNRDIFHIGFWLFTGTICWFSFDFSVWNWELRYSIHFVLSLYLTFIFFKWGNGLISSYRESRISLTVKRAVLTYIGALIVCLGFAVSLATSYIIGPIVFSITFYSILGYFVFASSEHKQSSLTEKIDPDELSKINRELLALMETEKLYQHPDISLESLSKKLSISRHLLSQILNDSINKSFYQFINEYRIREAREMLENKKHYSVEAIGYEVGFNSRSTFFSSFKKLTGTTPSKYRDLQSI